MWLCMPKIMASYCLPLDYIGRKLKYILVDYLEKYRITMILGLTLVFRNSTEQHRPNKNRGISSKLECYEQCLIIFRS